ncbi:MAG TPA: 4-hydroxybenzoate 3-monooxygenase [Gemmataceae bacterium]|nr:4-hydroxybenzoate 3-monooxygenase [Gemmataceae bacterium]
MTQSRRTQVAIIGAGPAGLLLSHLLDLRGVESVVLEVRSRQAVEATLRAGVLEQGTVDLLVACGVGDRLRREGFVHQGINLRFGGHTHRIDLHQRTGGRAITIYAQHEVLRDLIAAADAAGRDVVFEAHEVQVHDLETDQPRVTYSHDGQEEELHCDFIAGCDGFHGVARPSIPAGAIQSFRCEYQIGWLGMLVEAPPSSNELIYARHERGFARVSTRSPQLQRLYVQCDPHDDVSAWPDERIWDELDTRLATRDGWELIRGRISQKCIVSMRSFVAEPMQYGRLYLAGDAAHIVPPTGAKGMNLAVADVSVLAPALADYYVTGRTKRLRDYSDACLPRVWRAQRFSAWMTSALHRLPGMDDYRSRLQLAELEYLVHSPAAVTSLAENYVGFPLPSAALNTTTNMLAEPTLCGTNRT